MADQSYKLIVGGTEVPLKRVENLRLITPARDEHPGNVSARLARSSRLALDPSYPPGMIVMWGDKNKLEEVRAYQDIENTRSAFQDPEGNTFVLTNEILVNFVEGSSDEERERLLERYAGFVVERNGTLWKFRVKDPDEDAPLMIANELTNEAIVDYAEPNALQAPTLQLLPQNEPRFANQWHLQNTGQSGGAAGADVNALGAWGITRGSPSVRVVVHDSGVDINHPDLAANIVGGWDFDNNDNDASNPNGPHGTACAGVIAAATNGQGVTGIAPNCRIVPLRAAGSHTWQEWADTFNWAAQQGRIISCSWTITPNNTLSAAIRQAVANGVVVFCAAGNGGVGSVGYPASMAETIAVGASTNRNLLSWYSQWGPEIDFVAPSNGGTLNIETTDIQGANGYNGNLSPAGDYCNANDGTGFGGTSSATPLAAGIGALMLSVNPLLDPNDVRTILRETCDQIDAANANYDANGRSQRYGSGKVNASRAVQRARPVSAAGDDMQPGEVLLPGEAITSANGQYTFVYQGDGNLVLYRNSDGAPLWASNTPGSLAGICAMQGDGNLVVYNVNRVPIFASDTFGNPGCRLVAQDDGNVVVYRPDGTPIWATNTVQNPMPVGPVAAGDDMQPGEILRPGDAIASDNGQYTFVYQGDGNLVLYRNRDGRPLWASNTMGQSTGVCIMQADGNLVIYDANVAPVWASNTQGNPGSGLIAQDDGNTVIYRADGTPIWATNTVQVPMPSGPAATGADMQPGEVLVPGGSITSANGQFTFIYQGDGNLVLYRSWDGRPLWASNTMGQSTGVCIMQADGNLVIYDTDVAPIWASDTHGNAGSALVMQDDGNAVIYRTDGTPIWATNTMQPVLPSGTPASGNDVLTGEILRPGDSITSANGLYRLEYQTDGNLVLYRSSDGVPLWASNTEGHTGGICIMQADGNLVMYDTDVTPAWASNTAGNPNSGLVAQDDGNVVIYRPDGTPIWASNTNQ